MTSIQRPRVFLDVNIGEEAAGRLTIELFVDNTPRTCENFRQLCTGEHNGLSYARSPFHRVIDEFMIQGGDIQNGDGTGTLSIYGEEFEDENLGWREMSAAGLVCSANRGRDTNGSQFFITLEPCEHLNGKHTIFGRLVGGEDTLKKIAEVEVDKNDRPLEPVLVSRCGELERKKKKATAPAAAPNLASESHDRGRRRRSNDGDVQMSNSPEPGLPQKHRRQSDNLMDEGIRGRPRQRSGSRSPPRVHSSHEETEDSERGSPAKKHKRKRSASPSRHVDTGSTERRRRSLPNQYRDRRVDQDELDDERYKPSPRRDDHRHENRRWEDGGHGRKDDRYRPSRDRNPYGDDGRLGGGGYDDYDPPVKFKGRGVMKYREPERHW